MNKLLANGISEYRDQLQREIQFEGFARRIGNLLRSVGISDRSAFILLLTPMIEIAWVDGRIGRSEQNSVLKTADIYGLLDDENDLLEVMERLTTRPTPEQFTQWWENIYDLLHRQPLGQAAAITSMIYGQTRFVASQSRPHNYGWWNGHKAGVDEVHHLDAIESKLSKSIIRRDDAEPNPDAEPSSDLLKVVPLVKVAWADGRITKRERQLIFDMLVEIGVERTSENIARIREWLRLRPEEAFFEGSLNKLREDLSSLNDDLRADEKYGLISRCTLIAEASGGNSQYAGGGLKICHEETAAVKQIARILNGAAMRSGSAVIAGRVDR